MYIYISIYILCMCTYIYICIYIYIHILVFVYFICFHNMMLYFIVSCTDDMSIIGALMGSFTNRCQESIEKILEPYIPKDDERPGP